MVAHLFQQAATVAGSDCFKPAFMYYTKILWNTTDEAPRQTPIEVRIVWTVRAEQAAKSRRPGVIVKRVGRTLSPFPSLCKCELCRKTQRSIRHFQLFLKAGRAPRREVYPGAALYDLRACVAANLALWLVYSYGKPIRPSPGYTEMGFICRLQPFSGKLLREYF